MIQKSYMWIFYILSLAIFSNGCALLQDRTQDDDITAYFKKRKQEIKIGYYETHGREIRYATTGADSLPTLLLIHGAPSSMSVFNQLMTHKHLVNKFQIFVLDRPGYGYSGFGEPVTSIRQQSEMIRPILDSLRSSRNQVIVLGVSYGGPIAARLAADYPDLVDGLVLGAPAIAPGEEKVYLISHLMRYSMTNWIFPKVLNVATAEKFSHRKELEEMQHIWANLTKPIIYVQGENDELVYTSNAKFIEKKAVKVPFLKIMMIPGQPHFLAIPQKDLLATSVLEMLDIISGKEYIAGKYDFQDTLEEEEILAN